MQTTIMRRNPENRHQTRRPEHYLRKHRQQKQIKESFSLPCISFKLPPPPQISFFLPLCDSLSFSEHVFLSASGLCSCAHSSQSLLCIYSFFLIINFSLSLSLCTVVNRSLGHLDHDCLPGSVFVEILQRSIGCLLPKGTKQEEGREERD